MTRIIAFIVAAAAVFAVLWLLLSGVIHTLFVAFWIVVVALLGVGLFRAGRRTGRRTR